jgi:hypothetical protein
MSQFIIITDLTRFSNPHLVCIAGIEITTGQCIRPMPYLGMAQCLALNALPGSILMGEFSPVPDCHCMNPHREDMNYQDLKAIGMCHEERFKSLLEENLSDSIEAGFNINSHRKYIPLDHETTRSIITIKVNPHHVQIVKNSYKPNSGRLKFTDPSKDEEFYFSITDLGFHSLIETHLQQNDLYKLNTFIHKQSEIYLRIGLSRAWQKPDTGEHGFWMQVNGIYTFPNYHPEIRNYR